jgi:predicted neutral ceramidase superfamily lipid hydrolase
MNIQMDCHFVGKSSTSDDEVKNFFSGGGSHPQKMPINTSNITDNL